MSEFEFQEEVISNLTKLSNDQLLKLEKDIGEEFSRLGRSYIEARLVRIHQMIEKLNNSIKLVNLNDKNWLKIYNFEIETINNIKTNTEDLILVNEGLLSNKPDLIRSIDEYEQELLEIFKSLQSPLNFDESINNCQNSKLPLPYLFDAFAKNHKTNLQTIINEKNYQTNLLKNLAKSNSTIIWKQYHHKLMNRKQELIDNTLHELYQLNKQYQLQDQNISYSNNINHYYKSLLSPQELIDCYSKENQNTINSKNLSAIIKNSRDPKYYNLNDNTYINKNKVELSDIRKNIIKNHNLFNSQQNYSQNPNKRVKLNTCTGLSHNQIDNDLDMIKQGIRIIEAYRDDVNNEDDDSYDNENNGDNTNDSGNDNDNDNDNGDDEDEDDNDIDDIDEDEEIERQELMKKAQEADKAKEELDHNYRKLLQMDRSESPLSSTVFELPPLEKFPSLH